MVPIVTTWLFKYVENPTPVENYLKESSVAREIGRSVYQYFVNSKQIQNIKYYTEKERIWNVALSWGKLPRVESIKLAKSIYLFEILLQRKIE